MQWSVISTVRFHTIVDIHAVADQHYIRLNSTTTTAVYCFCTAMVVTTVTQLDNNRQTNTNRQSLLSATHHTDMQTQQTTQEQRQRGEQMLNTAPQSLQTTWLQQQ